MPKTFTNSSVDLDAFTRMMLALEDGEYGKALKSLTFELKNVDHVVKEARNLVKENKKQDAIRLLSAHLETHPDNFQLIIAIAKTYKGVRDINQAYLWMEKASLANPKYPVPHLFLIETDLQRKHFKTAKIRIKTFAEFAPRTSHYIYCKALLALHSNEFDKAKTLLADAKKIKPPYKGIQSTSAFVDNVLRKRAEKHSSQLSLPAPPPM